jgi:hypothetical protein
MNFIKRVFDKKIDDETHAQFQKFSRGEFKNRAMIKAKKVKDKYTISTTSEFANEFVKMVAERLGKNKTKVSGVLVSTADLGNEIDYQNKKQFMGVKQYVINKEMSGDEIIGLIEKFPKVFFALSLDSGKGDILKTKAKAPKSAKPKNKDEAPKPDFCKLITHDENIMKEFVWESDFKEAEIFHDFIIESIVIPESIKNEKDFAIVREKSLRKGKVVRRGKIDDKEINEVVNFEA